MEQEQTVSYPVMEFVEHLRQLEEQMGDDEHIHVNLANMLEACHATMEYANAIWAAGCFASEGPDMPTYQALGYGMSRLVPTILKCIVGGWRELMMLIDNHEEYPWYDPDEEYPVLPPRMTEEQRAVWEQDTELMLAEIRECLARQNKYVELSVIRPVRR